MGILSDDLEYIKAYANSNYEISVEITLRMKIRSRILVCLIGTEVYANSNYEIKVQITLRMKTRLRIKPIWTCHDFNNVLNLNEVE